MTDTNVLEKKQKEVKADAVTNVYDSLYAKEESLSPTFTVKLKVGDIEAPFEFRRPNMKGIGFLQESLAYTKLIPKAKMNAILKEFGDEGAYCLNAITPLIRLSISPKLWYEDKEGCLNLLAFEGGHLARLIALVNEELTGDTVVADSFRRLDTED